MLATASLNAGKCLVQVSSHKQIAHAMVSIEDLVKHVHVVKMSVGSHGQSNVNRVSN